MKATGIVRRIDDLGRVVIPKEIRRTLRIKEGTPLEIFTDREGEIILKKYSPIGELSLVAKEYAESLSHSTGMLSCITDHDQVVAAAGPGSKEFIGKLISSQLEAVINAPENEIVYGLVDGNLMWRVLSNLLSNACKYSQPNTRVYIQIKQNADLVFITVKNISRDQLNIDPDELMERFVRGDSSRSTEGSGLGLNIARSLVELQKGKFFLSIDGDLFKAQIRFARASLPEAQPNPEETTAEN